MPRTFHATEPQQFKHATIEPVVALDKRTGRRKPVQLSFPLFEDARRDAIVSEQLWDRKANRATLFFPPGVPATYRFVALTAPGKAEVRFCWTVHRNAAGRFLIFRETVSGTRIKRDRFEAILDKRAAISACRLYRRELIAQREKKDAR